jgi:hypothetical protein
MFRAIDKECGEEIIILDEKWHPGNIEQLRLKGRSKILHWPEYTYSEMYGWDNAVFASIVFAIVAYFYASFAKYWQFREESANNPN